MSAINPASFATPTAGTHPPSSIGPGALGPGRDPGSALRQYDLYGGRGGLDTHHQMQSPLSAGSFGQSLESGRETNGGNGSTYMDPYQSFAQGIRQAGLGQSAYGQQPQADTFSNYSSQGAFTPTSPYTAGSSQTTGSAFGSGTFGLPQGFGGFNGSAIGQNGSGPRKNPNSGNNMASSFQGLSLGS